MHDIKEARLKKGLTQLELANMIGYKSAGIVRKAERGELEGEKLKRILSVLGLSENASYIIYTDGGCEVNPGGRGGYGVVVIDKETGEITEYNGGFTCTTNNRMEIYAFITACENIPVGSAAVIYSDSQYVVNTVNGYFSKGKNMDLWDRLDSAMKGKKIRARWVRGHNNDRFNERCDELATQGYLEKAFNRDPGYFGKSVKTKTRSEKIDVKRGPAPVITDENLFAREHSINPKCARKIKDFYNQSDHNFKSYMNLKTFGMDYWSSRSLDDLKKEFPDEYKTASKYIESEKDIASVLRWKGRGLDLYDCIKKVLTDIEIRNNIR